MIQQRGDSDSTIRMNDGYDRSGKASILVVGSANMDMVVSCDRFPLPGETVLANGFDTFPGGKGANQAVAAAKLGGRVHFLGKLGSDSFRLSLLESLKREGVHLGGVMTDEHASTGVALITVAEGGENQIVVASGSNMRLSVSDLEKHEALFRDASVVLIQLEIPLETAMRAAELGRAHGAVVILNPAPAMELPDAFLANLDFITPNETEVDQLAGLTPDGVPTTAASARMLVQRGAKNVIVTLGEQGALWVSEKGVEHFEAFEVEVADTTAGGDAFNGALAYALAKGMPLSEAICLSNAVGAFAVMRHGAQPSMPDRQAIEEFIDQREAHATQNAR
ncbi:ribokinase [soil metagenome]